MVLRWKLLRAELISRNNLLGKIPRVQEPIAVEWDLGDHCIVRNHHRHRSKQGLKVIRKLTSACIPWVHRDEDIARSLQRNRRLVKDKRLFLVPLRCLDLKNLLSHDWKHLQLNPIKLIKARPTSIRRQSFKELGHSLRIQPLSAVKHHTMHSHSLGQILRWLSLARPGRSFRSASQVEMHGWHEGPVAPVCEGGDDETSGVAKVFVHVGKGGLDHFDEDLFGLVVVVVTHLGEPVEVVQVFDTFGVEFFEDVSGVDVKNN